MSGALGGIGGAIVGNILYDKFGRAIPNEGQGHANVHEHAGHNDPQGQVPNQPQQPGETYDPNAAVGGDWGAPASNAPDEGAGGDWGNAAPAQQGGGDWGSPEPTGSPEPDNGGDWGGGGGGAEPDAGGGDWGGGGGDSGGTDDNQGSW